MVLVAVLEATRTLKESCVLRGHTSSANVRACFSQGRRSKEAHIAGLCEDMESPECITWLDARAGWEVTN